MCKFIFHILLDGIQNVNSSFQVTPIPPEYVAQVKQGTPADYPLADTGFSVTIGQTASQQLQVCLFIHYSFLIYIKLNINIT